MLKDYDSEDSHTAALIVPQLGEGQRSVNVIALLKQPGDRVELDEALYEVETDKATVAVESPFAGVLKEWLANVGDSVDVHAPIARLIVSGRAPSIAASSPSENRSPAASPLAQAAVRIPPRTRAFCRRHGLTEEVVAGIPARGTTLSEEDVLRFLQSNSRQPGARSQDGEGHRDFPLTERQRALNRATLNGRPDQPLAASVRYCLPWDLVEKAVAAGKRAFPEASPTEFQVLAYCAAKAAIEHPKFRSRLLDSGNGRQYDHLNLGFAVALPDDELCTASIEDADTLDLIAFVRAMRSRQRVARRTGETQAGETTTLILSSLRSRQVTDATPILVPPAAAVLFFGHPVTSGDSLSFSMTLTFDHRLINGVGAERFLGSIASRLAAV